MPYATPQNRPQASGQTLRWISHETCWHFDAWLYATHDAFVFDVQTREGGRELLASTRYIVRDGEFVAVAPESVNLRNAKLVTLNELDDARRDYANALHWTQLYPRSINVPSGYKRRSARFWYIEPMTLDPMDGIPNAYQTTGRAERDERMAETMALRSALNGLL